MWTLRVAILWTFVYLGWDHAVFVCIALLGSRSCYSAHVQCRLRWQSAKCYSLILLLFHSQKKGLGMRLAVVEWPLTLFVVPIGTHSNNIHWISPPPPPSQNWSSLVYTGRDQALTLLCPPNEEPYIAIPELIAKVTIMVYMYLILWIRQPIVTPTWISLVHCPIW